MLENTLTIFIGNPKDNHVYMTMPFSPLCSTNSFMLSAQSE